eukprot:sb/3474500/
MWLGAEEWRLERFLATSFRITISVLLRAKKKSKVPRHVLAPRYPSYQNYPGSVVRVPVTHGLPSTSGNLPGRPRENSRKSKISYLLSKLDKSRLLPTNLDPLNTMLPTEKLSKVKNMLKIDIRSRPNIQANTKYQF